MIRLLSFLLVVTFILSISAEHRACTDLLPGQFLCGEEEINPETQLPKNCSKHHTYTLVPCIPAPGIICDGKSFNGTTVGFYRQRSCRWTNGARFDISLLLSIFGGSFGLDRFYLGYPALGLLKLFTVGVLGVGHLLDVILIASQIVGPADGSQYFLPFYGPRLVRLVRSNETRLDLPYR